MIDRIRSMFPEIDLTDDCAAIISPDSEQFLFTIDAGLRGTHFPEDPRFMANAGWRTMAGAASDINASGGIPFSSLLALQIPSDMLLSEFDAFMHGVREFVEWSGIPLTGGNITRGNSFSATVSVLGSVRKKIGRDKAKPSEIVVLTGNVGGSEAGRIVAMNEIDDDLLSAKTRETLISRYMRPTPPFTLGEKLAQIGASAMIDISDGLLADISHIAKASGISIDIELKKIPIMPEAAELAKATQIDRYKLAAMSGEEFELLVTIPGSFFDNARKLANKRGSELTIIGETKSGEGISVYLESEKIEPDYLGWRHF